MRHKSHLSISLLFYFLIFSSIFAAAQDYQQAPKSRFIDKLFVGGGLGLQFGSLTLIDITPMVGYRVTEKFETGIGLTYKYYKYNDYYGLGIDLKSNIIGGSIFARYHIIENLFAHIEYESLRYRYDEYYGSIGALTSENRIAYINSFFIGGGYRQRISQSSYFYIMALWNLNETTLSPYSNPVLRMGVALGL